jgi:hypothetical protein
MVRTPKTTCRLIVSPEKTLAGFSCCVTAIHTGNTLPISAASCENAVTSRSSNQRGSLTTQQGPKAMRLKLRRALPCAVGRIWSVSVCGVALPLLRRRGRAHGFHSVDPPNSFPPPQPYHWPRFMKGPDLRQFEEVFQAGGVMGSIPLAHGLTTYRDSPRSLTR